VASLTGVAGATTTTGPAAPNAAPSIATTTAPVPLTKAQGALCAADNKTVKGSEPVLGFDGSNKDAPLSLLGQVRVSGVGVRQAVRAELTFLDDLVQATPPVDRGVLAPYVAAYRQVLGIVRADHDNLTRVNTDRRLPSDDPLVVTPPAGAAALIAGLLRVCPVRGRPTATGHESRTASP